MLERVMLYLNSRLCRLLRQGMLFYRSWVFPHSLPKQSACACELTHVVYRTAAGSEASVTPRGAELLSLPFLSDRGLRAW